MKKPMIVMLICVGILFGLIFAWKAFGYYMMKRYFATSKAPPVVVSTMKVSSLPWQPKVRATGSVRAIRGVNLTTSLAGTVQKIYFTPGSVVQEGTLLVQLNADAELGQLAALDANAKLAEITLKRDKAQYDAKAISKQLLETDEQNLKNAQGLVAQQTAIVAKKTIRAPFTGKLGINNVSPGQYINPGDKIVMLQAIDPIYIDFFVPQQDLVSVKMSQTVNVISDLFPKKFYTGKITTINPAIEQDTRNVIIEATVDNPKGELVPGMFVRTEVNVGEPKKFVTVPQTAITFNPYGEVVYLVKQKIRNKDKSSLGLIAQQAFVVTGETRGDQITVLKGLNPGDVIVTSGQVKLKNESTITVNNKVQPANNPDPEILNP